MRSRQVDLVERRLSRAHTVADLAEIARRRTPRSVFEYVSGGAEGEVGIARAREAYDRIEFRPYVLRDVSAVDTSTSILGRKAALPLILAPTGFTRMMHHEGETAVARAAGAAGVPYALSTMGTATIEEVTSTAPTGANWFQLYLWKDRAASKDLVQRAVQAGVDVLVLTVDTPVPGNRLRDVRNGMTIPPTLNMRTLADMTRHPSWWMNLLTTEPLEFANLTSFEGTVGDLVKSMFDPSLSFADLEWLRSEWPGKLVVKGIQDVADARDVVAAGADALVVSNHGGRQLDRAPTPLELLPEVVDAVGSGVEVYVDTGITTGSDLIAAVGLGATAAMVGRAYLYGLMAGGQRGVASALEIFRSEATRTMQLMGAQSLADVRGRVTLRS
ncbi:alpha-hydroxy acid oxidase [Rhodococcoides fascians]|uniref:alpha-hydroxy acid oxidase n=1 Tax=Rhodococcoides fascians TaxID=1828 RepID=UPI001E3DBD33|nr:alpha-hydroxy acid oxidase [Rhodococcus fascians]